MENIHPFVILSFLATIPALIEGAFCHENWISYESKCYRPINIRKNYYTADLFCMITGNQLASISSIEVLEVLTSNIVKDRDTDFWVGLEISQLEGKSIWKDGTNAANQSWISSDLMATAYPPQCSLFDTTNNLVISKKCDIVHSFICETNKTMFNPIEHCKEGLTQHSFIGEVTGRCLYRLPITTKKEKVEKACSDSGGAFVDLHDVMNDGLNAFYEHKVMTNDGLKYWTYLTWNGSHVLWETGEVLQHHIPFIEGTGSCVTVAFNFTGSNLEINLFQTECNSQAHILCSANPSLMSTTSAVTVAPRNIYCPQGHNWKSSSVTGACYWETSYETSRLSWDDARSYCQGYGGDLASFHSIEEEKIGLSFQYGSLAHPYWIGLRLDLATGSYKWSDGSPLDYENWAPNHPDHKDKRLQCVSMDAKSKHWTSSLCGIVSWFVCKSPKRAEPYAAIIPTRPPMVKCEGGRTNAYYYQGYCYTIGIVRHSWHRAKRYCEDIGYKLLSIHSDSEIGFLLRMLYDNKDTSGNRVWIGLNSLSRGIFRWSDGSPIDFTYWNENEPNNYQNQEKCCNMYVGNGLWNDENCNTEMNFICKQNKDAPDVDDKLTTIDPLIGNCKKGWLPYHDRCYLLRGSVAKDRLNWTDASEYCTKLGGYITSIRNSKEQAYLAFLMQNAKSDTWIGFHDTIESGKYYWMDNSDISYTNWDSGEPSFFGIQEDCVKMKYNSATSGVWEDDVCSKKLPFICQMEKDKKLPVPPYNHDIQCIHPQGWLRQGVMCYKMYGGNTMTWDQAETACKRDGAELISITGTEIMAVANFLGTEVNQSYWIGLRNSEENKLSWVNKWPITLTKWGKNEPKSYDEKLCYSSTPDGYWERTPCDQELPYICQITTGKPPPIKKYAGDCIKTSSDWVPTSGSYCLLPVKTLKDWYSAFLYCFSYGSYLPSIHSLEDSKKLKEAFDPEVNTVFLGLSKNEKGGFIWSDGSPVDYVNWDVEEPVVDNEDRCAQMDMETLKWRTVSCLVTRLTACQIRKVVEIEDSAPENAQLSSDSSSGLSTAAIAGIFVVAFLVIGLIVGAYFARNSFGKNRFRIPFRLVQSVSFDNALYNVDSTSVEFNDDRR
ncbi:macrophage mannose receptor 1 [Parasteatoda tepidariorum]|uniref:macrophage mannose receptor 1 n=1 Tax=Parasteatoda tepidariorum TaxID=114398 RepID=UPI0039BD3DD5